MSTNMSFSSCFRLNAVALILHITNMLFMVPNIIPSDCRDNIFVVPDREHECRGVYCNFLPGISSF